MFSAFLTQLSQLSLLISVLVMILLYFLFISQWSNIQSHYLLRYYHHGDQRTHEGEVPRLGGLVIIIGLFIHWLLSQDELAMPFFKCILISCLPVVFISLKEDLIQNTQASSRLLFMAISCILFFLSFNITFPIIQLPYFGELLSNSYPLSIIFFSLCVLTIINGSNLIDGANGLLPMTIIMQCLSLFYLCYLTGDTTNMLRLVYIIIPLLVFMAFNYPWGAIFLGDTGAYFLGFMVSQLTIIIFSDHPEIPTWLAGIILFYPAFELLFSFFRKLVELKSPLNPDPHHLHLKMFHMLKNQVIRTRTSNCLVMPCLAIIWTFPFILSVLVSNSLFSSVIAIFLLITIYIGLYWALPRKIN
jgi:UDP-GlcNAc:undecaprenyl-phosphate GlcNAc-1-phosphate transferase